MTFNCSLPYSMGLNISDLWYFSNLILCLPLPSGHKTLSLSEFYTVLPSARTTYTLLRGQLLIILRVLTFIRVNQPSFVSVSPFFFSPQHLAPFLKQVSSSVTISSLLVSYLPSVESQLCEDKARGFLHFASLEPGSSEGLNRELIAKFQKSRMFL